jgi:hypothetical protein
MQEDNSDTRLVIWFSRILRWGLGGLFIWAGIHFDGYWPAILFGAAFVITGFFRPKRCLEEGSDCSVGVSPGQPEKSAGREGLL